MLDAYTTRCQFDVYAFNTIELAQRVLDVPHARSAAHAGDLKV
jgi:hypothetical protein